MLKKSPHIIIIPFVYGVIHMTQSGVDFVRSVSPPQWAAQTTIASETIAALSAWLFVFYILPCGARFILSVYAIGGNATDRFCSWATKEFIKLARWVLNRLDGNDP